MASKPNKTKQKQVAGPELHFANSRAALDFSL